MNGLTDTHAHLCDPVFDPDLDRVLDTARQSGIDYVIAVGENMSDAEKNLDLAGVHPMIRPAAGLFPTLLNTDNASEMYAFIRSHAVSLAAIGEVGLDYWKVQAETEREIQRDIFAGFIRLSRELNRPLNVHSRSAGRHTVEFLMKHSAVRVQLHAFDGKPSSALPAVEAGYFFSIPPSVVRSPQKQKLVKTLPLTSLLIETDSPVLGAVPGERNEPSRALLAVKAIAELKNLKETDVAEAVIENTRRLYADRLAAHSMMHE